MTEELFPGYRLPACSYICHLLQTKVIEELELRKHGFEVYHLDPWWFQPYGEKKSESGLVEGVDAIAPGTPEGFEQASVALSNHSGSIASDASKEALQDRKSNPTWTGIMWGRDTSPTHLCRVGREYTKQETAA